jgi:hypothetical protein
LLLGYLRHLRHLRSEIAFPIAKRRGVAGLLIELIENGRAFLLTDKIRFPNKLILPLINISEMLLQRIDETVRNELKFFVLVVSVLVLCEDDQLSSEFGQRRKFLLLELGNVIGHLISFSFQGVLLHGFEDAGVVGYVVLRSLHISSTVWSVFRSIVDGSAFDTKFDLVFQSFYLHYFSFHVCVFLHIVTVDAIELCVDRYFEVVDVVLHFFL